MHETGATLDICDKCGGMWLDKDEVNLLYNQSIPKKAGSSGLKQPVRKSLQSLKSKSARKQR